MRVMTIIMRLLMMFLILHIKQYMNPIDGNNRRFGFKLRKTFCGLILMCSTGLNLDPACQFSILHGSILTKFVKYENRPTQNHQIWRAILAMRAQT